MQDPPGLYSILRRIDMSPESITLPRHPGKLMAIDRVPPAEIAAARAARATWGPEGPPSRQVIRARARAEQKGQPKH